MTLKSASSVWMSVSQLIVLDKESKSEENRIRSIGPKHLLTPEESIVFIKQTLGVEIV